MKIPRWLTLFTGFFAVVGGGFALGLDQNGATRVYDVVVVIVGAYWLWKGCN